MIKEVKGNKFDVIQEDKMDSSDNIFKAFRQLVSKFFHI